MESNPPSANLSRPPRAMSERGARKDGAEEMETTTADSIAESADAVDADDLQLEKRSSERSAITLRVDYKRLNTFFADYTKNISKGGTFIRTAKPLDVGTQFLFVLSFPSSEGQLRLKGEVMWTVSDERATSEQPSGMGIRFLFQDDGERERVASFVERLMADALGEHISSKLLKRG